MDRPTAVPLRVGAWRIDPARGQISRGAEVVRVEARTMKLLMCLAQRSGEVVSIDDLLSEVWSGVVVAPDSVYQAVTSLRRVLGDDPKRPTYIATVPRLGYRLIADVGVWADEASVAPTRTPADGTATSAPGPAMAATPAAATPAAPAAASAAIPDAAERRPELTGRTSASRGSLALLAIAIAALTIAVTSVLLLHSTTATTTQSALASPTAPSKSVAVLPFLDLTTQEMNEEYFADGMTEELIDRLSKVPDLHVPSATSSFYFKGKQLKVAEIAKSLGVTYVLDGSIRKSDNTLRVAARLLRANDGYVIWSETYDRPLDNKLKIQDDIAGEVAKALKASIH